MFLSTWRAAFANTTVTMQDLTDGNEFDWFAYLAGHRAGAVIFGGESGQTPPTRVVWFIIAKLAVLDEDVTMNDHRVNFCVFLEGGAMVMLHPTATGEEEAVVTMTPETVLLNGRIPQLLGVGRPSIARAADAVTRGWVRSSSVRENLERALAEGLRSGMLSEESDRIRRILNERARKWELERQSQPWPFRFTMNITSADSSTDHGIAWRLLFRSIPAMHTVLGNFDDVKEVWIVWLGRGLGCPGLYIQKVGGEEFVLHFTEGGISVLRYVLDCILWHV
jgi:hypothetical protein